MYSKWDRIGGYELIRLIRLGSSCQVWEARRGADEESYALKIMKPELRGKTEEIVHLKREFEIASRLNHQNIIKVIECNTDLQTPFFVMELFSEINLKQTVRRGPETIASKLPSIIEQTCQSLHYLHTQGYVHCDIKPENLLSSREFNIKLIDFSTAKKVMSGLGKLFGGKSKIEGTRWYMSPEQIRGLQLDARSDIYSAGCMMFELTTGRVPFTGTTPNEVLHKHLNASRPDAVELKHNLTGEFSDLLKILMDVNPKSRPRNMMEVRELFRSTPIFNMDPFSIGEL